MSLEQATYSVNLWRAEQDPVLEHVGISAVASCYHALEPVVSQIVDLKQGLDDPDSFWARARRNWAIQMSLLFELITEEELVEEWEELHAEWLGAEIPDWAKLENIGPTICVEQVCDWDETHFRAHIGGVGHDGANSRTRRQFYRDPETSALLPRDQGGQLAKAIGGVLKVKFPKESRLSLGCGCRNGMWEVLTSFDYTEKNIVTIGVYEKAAEAEVREMRAHGSAARFVEKRRPEGAVYSMDPVSRLFKSANTKTEAYLKKAGLEHVHQLPPLLVDPTEFDRVIERNSRRAKRKSSKDPLKAKAWKMRFEVQEKGATKEKWCTGTISDLADDGTATLTFPDKHVEHNISVDDPDLQHNELVRHEDLARKTLRELCEKAKTATAGAGEEDIDHRLTDHPYKSRFKDDWEEELAKDMRSRHHMICVKELVRHIVSEGRRIHKGGPYEDSWVFYHDALSQMTDSACKDWMKAEGFWKHWLVTRAGCNDLIKRKDGKTSTDYGERVPGNNPEGNGWDSHLNNDVKDILNLHVAMTAHEPDEEKQFSRATPKRQTWALLRCLQGLPHRRIKEDMERSKGPTIDTIRKAGGVIVPELGDRQGRRGDVARQSGGGGGHGGHREKGAAPSTKWLHPDARPAAKKRKEAAEERVEAAKKRRGEGASGAG